jgi:hypothetical protein
MFMGAHGLSVDSRQSVLLHGRFCKGYHSGADAPGLAEPRQQGFRPKALAETACGDFHRLESTIRRLASRIALISDMMVR